MAYGCTNHYGIPFPRKGDVISAAQEEKKARIIDNQLTAANRLSESVVMKEGLFSLNNENDVFSLRLSGYGPTPTVMGTIRGGLCLTYSSIVWTGMVPGYKYWCYLDWTSSMFEDPEHFNLSKTRSPKENKNTSLLMAVVDLTGKEPKYDDKPAGKRYAHEIFNHPEVTENPHGKFMKVDEIEVKNLVVNGTKILDEENPELLTENKTIVGAINEIYRLLQQLRDK